MFSHREGRARKNANHGSKTSLYYGSERLLPVSHLVRLCLFCPFMSIHSAISRNLNYHYTVD